MFDIGWSEMLVVGAVAVLVVGPRELPGMLRTFGKYVGQMRRMAGEFQSQFNDALKEADLDEVRRGIESVRSASPASQLRKEFSALTEAGDSVKKAIEDPGAKSAGGVAKAGEGPRPDPVAPATGSSDATPGDAAIPQVTAQSAVPSVAPDVPVAATAGPPATRPDETRATETAS